MRILVVENEPDLARTLRKALEEEAFAVDLAFNGEDALHRGREIPYDVVVLDLMLPRLDGWHVLQALRAGGTRTPVLILTARDSTEDKIRGLDLGADDYLTKPFAITELVARLRALIRRASIDRAPVLIGGDATIDTAARSVCREGRPVDLTAKEYAVLEFLARRRGTLVTRSMLCDHLYNEDGEVFSNVVDVHVAALRRKLGRDLIQTRRGHGYIIDG
jgi:two-component system OmpR family response regulator